jgi:hypothetical protein
MKRRHLLILSAILACGLGAPPAEAGLRDALHKAGQRIEETAGKAVGRAKEALPNAGAAVQRLVFGDISRAAKDAVVSAKDAESVLKPGDLLIKFITKKWAATSRLIQAGQRLIKAAFALARKGHKGDPRGFHVAIYLGNGQVAEAYGGSLASARVGTRSLDAHDGFVFEVFRPVDRTLAARAVEVARRWATARMKYLVPIVAAVHSASFGARARREALRFGRDAGREGGPQGFDKMFCSQFAIAAYQAAALAPVLAKNPRLAEKDVQVPLGIDLHASVASPVRLHARLREAVERGLWQFAGRVFVRK